MAPQRAQALLHHLYINLAEVRVWGYLGGGMLWSEWRCIYNIPVPGVTFFCGRTGFRGQCPWYVLRSGCIFLENLLGKVLRKGSWKTTPRIPVGKFTI
jgi:hypothetical protein